VLRLQTSTKSVAVAIGSYHASRAPNNTGSCSVTPPERTWQDHVIAVHEASHCVLANYFGLKVRLATMGCVYVPHRLCRAPDDSASMEALTINAAGVAATACFLNYNDGDVGDMENSLKQLRHFGVGYSQARSLLATAREVAVRLAWDLKDEIFSVAHALREHRTLTQDQIDALL
jgi:hypothetical protein